MNDNYQAYMNKNQSKSYINTSEDYTDEGIVEKILDKNDKNTKDILFQKLYNKYSDKAYYIGKKYGLNDDELKDVVQQVFIKVFEKLGSFKEKSKFSTRFYSIVRNTYISFMREQKKVLLTNEDKNYLEWESNNQIDIEDMEKRTSLQSMIFSLLSNDEQRILKLKYEQNRSTEEIVDIMQLKTISAVKMRLKRVKEKAYDLYIDQLKYN